MKEGNNSKPSLDLLPPLGAGRGPATCHFEKRSKQSRLLYLPQLGQSRSPPLPRAPKHVGRAMVIIHSTECTRRLILY